MQQFRSLGCAESGSCGRYPEKEVGKLGQRRSKREVRVLGCAESGSRTWGSDPGTDGWSFYLISWLPSELRTQAIRRDRVTSPAGLIQELVQARTSPGSA